ncbi:hypothetical protein M2138_001055 [Dysgonomonadaceae bacterium PH5-43]|nr:hypothetical protein [Dysgonomonadaceae bacterium PH5-43]
MRRKIFLLSVALHFTMLIQSQQIFTDISKYDLKKIENHAIKEHRKLLETDKKRNLTAVVYYAIRISNSFSPEHRTVDDFLSSISLFDKYRCYVYDDSISTLSITVEKPLSLLLIPTHITKMYIECITALNPDYIFECMNSFIDSSMFFCYKDGCVTVVHLDDGDNIVSYPLSELKIWKWNTGTRTKRYQFGLIYNQKNLLKVRSNGIDFAFKFYYLQREIYYNRHGTDTIKKLVTT